MAPSRLGCPIILGMPSPLEQRHAGSKAPLSMGTAAQHYLPVPLLGQLLTGWVLQRENVSLHSLTWHLLQNWAACVAAKDN